MEKERDTQTPKNRQITMSFDEPMDEVRYDVLLEPEKLRPEVEFANVQRVFEESKAFQFSAPNKIRQPRDVAYIFKQLETAAVENAFAVLVKDGRPTVIHLGMGSIRHCIAPCDSVMVADRKINADKIYFVHNHPSGNVHASMEDISVLKHWQQVFGDKMQPGIIINSRSGIFGEFSLDGKAVKSDLPEDSEQTQYPVKLYSFSKLVFSKDYKEAGTIRSSSDVAAFLAGQRLGARPKLSYLVLATNGSIRANVHTAYNSIHQENLKDLARQITNDANVFGGIMVITYGSLPLKQMQIKKLQDELYQQEIFLQDHINVQMDVNSLMMDSTDMPYKYQSANDDGWISCLREPEISYGKERKEDNPVQGLKDYTREEIKDLVKNHIETVMEEAGLDAQVIGVEIHGSRGRGDARPDSDLDVVVEYEGDMKEDGMFNLLNEDALRIDGVRVDVNPIRKQETGTLQEYMERSRAYDKENPERSNRIVPVISEEIEAANRRFNQELRLQVSGQLPKGHVYQLGMPSAILLSAGIPDLPIEMAASRLSDKSMQENHPFGLPEVENLVSSIQDPLAVFRSATHIGSNVILTELNHNGRNFVVAVQTNKKKGSIEINDIRSLYPKNSMAIAGWTMDELLDYTDKKRMVEWLSKQRSNSAEVRKLFDHATKVVQNFENPKIEMAEWLSKQRSNSADVRKLSDHATKVVQNFVPERKQTIVKNRKRGRGL